MRNPTRALPTLYPAVLALCTAVLGACTAADVAVDTDVSYDDRFGAATRMDVYRPDDGSAARPGVLMIHGGGWRAFDRHSMDEDARRLAGAGYVVFNIDYRLVPDGAFPKDVQDCLCALAFARAHAAEYGVDPARLASMGYSAGGHLASFVGVGAAVPEVAPDCATAGGGAPSLWAAPVAVVDGAGPEDLRTEPQVSTITEYVGGTIDQVPATYALASPITHVAPDSPPFLIINGEDDWFVSAQTQAEPMRDALDAAGVETRFLLVPGGGHLWNRGSDGDSWEIPLTSIDTPESQAAIVDFLDHEIGPASPFATGPAS
jgi:acetyl esterase/lipase